MFKRRVPVLRGITFAASCPLNYSRVALSGSPAVLGRWPCRPMTLRRPLSRVLPLTDLKNYKFNRITSGRPRSRICRVNR